MESRGSVGFGRIGRLARSLSRLLLRSNGVAHGPSKIVYGLIDRTRFARFSTRERHFRAVVRRENDGVGIRGLGDDQRLLRSGRMRGR